MGPPRRARSDRLRPPREGAAARGAALRARLRPRAPARAPRPAPQRDHAIPPQPAQGPERRARALEQRRGLGDRAMGRVWRALKTFYVKAYEDNLTGLSGMVAYNLLLSLFPLALLALFIASQVLQSGQLEDSIFK